MSETTYSKNYSDENAIKVKNPIADALDRLTAAFNGSSSGGESAKDYVKLTLESDLTEASENTLGALRDLFYPVPNLAEAIPVHFAEGYMYGGEFDYNQKTIVIDPLRILLDGGSVECYVDRNVLFMSDPIASFIRPITFSENDAPTEYLVGVYVKTEVTGATLDLVGYYDPARGMPNASIDFSTAEDEVTISLVVIDPVGAGDLDS